MDDATLKCFIHTEDLKTLVRIAKDQMMFPSFRNANPLLAQKIEWALHNAEKAEKERHERCREYSNRITDNRSIEELDEAYRLLTNGDRQKLIGE